MTPTATFIRKHRSVEPGPPRAAVARPQAEYLRIMTQPDRSFEVREWRCPLLNVRWHYHSEYEITLLASGRGLRCVGNDVRPFSSGDLVMLGPYLPHYWRNSLRHPNAPAHSIVVLFSPDCLGEDFFERPELKPVALLLKDSMRGLRFSGRTRQKAASLMRQLPGMEGPERILGFLQLLMALSRDGEREFLAEAGYSDSASREANSRIDRVCRYIEQNFQQPLPLAQIARLANMSPAPFCRFFKRITQLTLSEYINRTRIDHASGLLVETDLAISEICYSSGYSTLSNFNRCFREQKRVSPTDFRRQFNRAYPAPAADSSTFSRRY